MQPQTSSAASPLLSERLCDWVVLGYAAWTLLCHAVVWARGSLRDLLIASAGCAGVALCAALFWRRRGSADAAPASSEPVGSQAQALVPEGLWRRVALSLAFGSALLLLYRFTGSALLIWWLATLYFLALSVATARRPMADGREAGGGAARRAPRWEALLWVLVVASALLGLFVHRRSPDDAYYVNVAVAAVDDLDSTLLHFDRLFGIADLPVQFAVYKTVSFELLAAALSVLTGLEAIEVFHWVLPFLFGPFVVLALARLLRELAPGIWIWPLVVVVALLVGIGDPFHTYGNYAFVKLQQGKSVFLSAMVPLLICYALQFSRAPSLRNWLFVFCALVASAGFSSTALWAAPAVIGLALCAGLRLSGRGLAVFALGLGSTIYVLALALALRGQSAAESSVWGTSLEGEVLVRNAWRDVLGLGPLAALSLLALVSAWAWPAPERTRRVALVFPLGVLLCLLNPYLAQPISNAIAVTSYFRVLWVLPIPLFLALFLCAPLHLRRAPGLLRIAASLLLAALVVALVPEVHGLSSANRLHWEPFGLKVPRQPYQAARILVESVPPRSHVLAPQSVSMYVGTFSQHPFALMPQETYLTVQRRHLDPREVALRTQLSECVAGAPTSDLAGLLTLGVQRFDLSGLCLNSTGSQVEEIRALLSRLGFRKVEQLRRLEIWAIPLEPQAREGR